MPGLTSRGTVDWGLTSRLVAKTHHLREGTPHSPQTRSSSACASVINHLGPSSISQAPGTRVKQGIRRTLTKSAQGCFARPVCAATRIKGPPSHARALGGRPQRPRMERSHTTELDHTLAGVARPVRGNTTSRARQSSIISTLPTTCSSSRKEKFASRSIPSRARQSVFVIWGRAPYSASMPQSMATPAVPVSWLGPSARSPRCPPKPSDSCC